MNHADPRYLRPAFSRGNRVRRALWGVVWNLLFRTSPRPLFAWRSALLRLFGAQMEAHCHVYPGARVWAPWNLHCATGAAIADEAIVYNPSPIRLGTHAIVSQQAYLCGATHDADDPGFPLRSAPIEIGDYAWICARATVMPGVRVGARAVLALGSVATRDLPPGMICAGMPARPVRARGGGQA